MRKFMFVLAVMMTLGVVVQEASAFGRRCGGGIFTRHRANSVCVR